MDDFSDESQGWLTGEFSHNDFVMNREIINGQYLLTKQQLQNNAIPTYGFFPEIMVLADFQISVKAGFVEGYAETGYGISFRQSIQGSYKFTIKDNSFLFSSEVRQGLDSMMDILIDWTYSAAIVPGEQNELTVIANGDQITLLVNDEIVADLVDDTHSWGTIAVFNDMSVAGEQSTVAFDDFMLKTRAATIYSDVLGWPLTEQNLFVSYADGWDTGSVNKNLFSGNISLTDGQYKIDATAKMSYYQIYFPDGLDELDPVYMTVDIIVGDVPGNTSSGLVIQRGEERYLTFSYVYDEYFGMFETSLLDDHEWVKLADRYVNADFKGVKEIRLGVILAGENVVFLVDDEIYAEIRDPGFQSENLGIGFGSAETGDQGSWTFSNFSLYQPGSGETVAQTPQPTPTVQLRVTPTGEASPVGEQSVNPKDGANIVYVPAGDFLMGYAGATAKEDEGPEHLVYLDGYWLYETPVTNSQYRKCLQDERCTGTLSRFSDDTYPVVRIDWNQAVAYCEYAGGRLPTEAEWEKGARGTDGRLFPWGEQAPSCLLANYQGCFGNQVTRVGQFPDGLSPYGALDMLGTVWEWVSDWYDEDYYTYSPSANPIGPSEGEFRVQRGHSFESNVVYLRVTDRGRSNPSNEDYRKGFRCVIPDLP